jgi:GNAT superfamily N-acetyltransferase
MRAATLNDIPVLFNLLVRMQRESRMSVFKRDDEKTKQFLKWIVTNPAGIVLVDGEPVHAVLMGFVQEIWFSKDKEAFNLPFYVLPEHRKGPSAVRLLVAYKKRAIELGAHPAAVTWVNNSGITVAQTNKFIGRMGFSPVGEYFVATQ